MASESLRIKRIKTGDKVITVAVTFPTTLNPVLQNRAIPVFVDIEERTYNINVYEVESAIYEKKMTLRLPAVFAIPLGWTEY